MKYCSKCHQAKPRDEYQRSSASWDGYRPDCKECRRIARQKTPKNSQNRAVPAAGAA